MEIPASLTGANSPREEFEYDRITRTKGRVYARRLALARAVQKRKYILFGGSSSSNSGMIDERDASTPTETYRRRHDGWEQVRQELIRKGFPEFQHKSRNDIQKTDWQHVRRFVMDKRKKDATTKNDPVTELDTVVFDIVKSCGRYSKDAGEYCFEGEMDMMQENSHHINAYHQPSVSTSPDHHDRSDFKSNENGTEHIPQLSELLGLQFQDSHNTMSPPIQNHDHPHPVNFDAKLQETRLEREEYLTMQEKFRADIEAERLVQERLKTQLLLVQLNREDPTAAQKFNNPSEHTI